MSGTHEAWMRRCLELARRGAGSVSPNPMVGCVVVDAAGEVLGEGWHQTFGAAHAEKNAIEDAIRRGHELRLHDATLFVNLEPCNHHGKTPPCTDAILAARIPRVVLGAVDSNPLVQGSGVSRLREHGLDVVTGVLEHESRRLNEAFFHHIKTGRPLVTLKVAQTLDAQVATRSGDSRWISCEQSRRLVHRWRAELDAVLVGRGTALADDPQLTVRHVEGRQPFRIVLDREARLPASLRLFRDAHVSKTIAVLGASAGDPPYADDLAREGGHVIRVKENDGRLDLHNLLDQLGDGNEDLRPLQSLLVEAGPALATALLRHDLVDRFFLFVAPKIIGTGTPAVADLGLDRMADALRFVEVAWERVGDDLLVRGYFRKP